MLHVVRRLERRYPEHAPGMVTAAALLLACALAVGVGLMILR